MGDEGSLCGPSSGRTEMEQGGPDLQGPSKDRPSLRLLVPPTLLGLLVQGSASPPSTSSLPSTSLPACSFSTMAPASQTQCLKHLVPGIYTWQVLWGTSFSQA